MEAKLSAHRAQKRRIELFNHIKTRLLSMLPFQSHAIDIDKKDDDSRLEKEEYEVKIYGQFHFVHFNSYIFACFISD